MYVVDFVIFWVLLKHIHTVTSAAHNTTHHSRLNLSDHSVRRVAGDDLRVVQHVELLRRVAAGVQQSAGSSSLLRGGPEGTSSRRAPVRR